MHHHSRKEVGQKPSYSLLLPSVFQTVSHQLNTSEQQLGRDPSGAVHRVSLLGTEQGGKGWKMEMEKWGQPAETNQEMVYEPPETSQEE